MHPSSLPSFTRTQKNMITGIWHLVEVQSVVITGIIQEQIMTIQKIQYSFIVCGTYIEVTGQTQHKRRLERTKLKTTNLNTLLKKKKSYCWHICLNSQAQRECCKSLLHQRFRDIIKTKILTICFMAEEYCQPVKHLYCLLIKAAKTLVKTVWRPSNNIEILQVDYITPIQLKVPEHTCLFNPELKRWHKSQ